MNQRMMTMIGGVAALLLLSVLVGLVSMLYARPATAQTTGVPGMRQVTVVGTGEVSGRPDTATVTLGVESEAASAQESLSQNNAQAQAVIAKLKELGIDEKDIQTNNFSIYPTYNNDGRQVTGYHVSNTVTVKIRNLAGAGDLLDQVVQVGANSVSGISFSVDNPDELLAQARVAAIQQARQQAEQLAQASNAAVGEVLVITENVGSTPIPMPVAERAMAADMAASVPVQAGEQQLSVSVQVTFALR